MMACYSIPIFVTENVNAKIPLPNARNIKLAQLPMIVKSLGFVGFVTTGTEIGNKGLKNWSVRSSRI